MKDTTVALLILGGGAALGLTLYLVFRPNKASTPAPLVPQIPRAAPEDAAQGIVA